MLIGIKVGESHRNMVGLDVAEVDDWLDDLLPRELCAGVFFESCGVGEGDLDVLEEPELRGIRRDEFREAE